MVGAKWKQKSLQFPQTSGFFHMTRMNAFFLIINFLIWTSVGNDLQLLRLSVSDCALLL